MRNANRQSRKGAMAEEKTNPFKPGSARFKLWNRKHGKKPAASEPSKPAPKKREKKGTFDSFFNRGEAIDKAIEGEVSKLRQRQSTDGAN
jgi:hypothetical protein